MEDDKKNNGSFEDLSLKSTLLIIIYSYGFELSNLIQSKSIPVIKSERDVMSSSTIWDR